MDAMTWTSKLCLVASFAVCSGTAHAAERFHAVTETGEPGKIVLVEERIDVTVDRQYLDATLRQVYQNEGDVQLEGQYRLQMGSGTNVHGFAYWNGEEKIVGEVFEKNTAQQVYEEITGLGRDPGLLEQEGEGTFSFRVFPIAPGERKPVEVEVGAYLQRKGNTVHLRVPVDLPKAAIAIELKDERGIAAVRSSTHALTVDRKSDGRVVVRADQALGSIDAIEVDYDVREPEWTLTGAVHHDAGHDGYLLLSLATPTAVPSTAIAAKDVTLVLDRSGSMSGEPIAQARIAAMAVIERLRSDDRVNVIAFDDGVDTLFERPQTLTASVRRQALDYVAQIRDEGGTDIALALREALAHQIDDAQPDIVMFLTDGQSDSEAALEVAKRSHVDARVFTIGVGPGVERPLLSRLASERRGRFTYIEAASAIPAKVAELYSQIESPLVVDVELEVDGVTLVRTYPQSLPDLFVGDELRIAARTRGAGPATIVLKGKRDGQPVSFATTVEVPESTDRPWIGRLWAEARVGHLLEEIALHGGAEELANETIELALAYDLVTPYTSFLAIPANELTASTSETLAQAREQKRQILAANPDAVALSRKAMPPGDPILSVRAPEDARQVTAYFPFGLVKDMQWDPSLEFWTTRFLVPNSVSDGEYEVRIVILRADGTIEIATTPYTIDSAADTFQIDAESTSHGTLVRVHSVEPLREVIVSLANDPSRRFMLVDEGDHHVFSDVLQLGDGTHELRIVVSDLARNEAERVLTIGAKP